MRQRLLSYAAREEDASKAVRAVIVFSVITVLASAFAAYIRAQPLWTFTTVGVFVLFYFVEFLAAVFDRPGSIALFVPAVGMFGLCAWLLATDGSRLWLAVAALIGGWIINTAIREYTHDRFPT